MLEQPSIESLLEALRDPNWEVRAQAARKLRDVRTEKVPPLLLEAAKAPDLEVRLAVIETLSNFPEERVIELLQEALFDEEWEVQWAAMRSLGNIWKEPDLRKMGDKLPEKRVSGIEAVAKKSAHHLLRPLLASLDDESEAVQAASIRALAKLGDPAAIPHLKKLFPDAPRHLLALALEALDQLGDPEARKLSDQYLECCEECGQQLPPSFLHRLAQWGKKPRLLCQFHFDELTEKLLPFTGKLKVCKVCKVHWPKVECVEGACPDCRAKRYQALPPPNPKEQQFRCARCHKPRPNRDLSPVSRPDEPLCSKCAYQLSRLSANSPFLTQHAIQFLEEAFDNGYLMCSKCHHFRPLDEIVEGHDFRDDCRCTSCKR